MRRTASWRVISAEPPNRVHAGPAGQRSSAPAQNARPTNQDEQMLLKSTLVALALAGTALVTTNTANAQNYNRNSPAVTIGFGNVGIGYRNGYMGNDHNWHRWEH